MMGKFILALLVLNLCAAAFSEEVIGDANFDEGFRLSALDSRANPVDIGVLFAKDGSAPCWRMDQWGSKFNLKDAVLQKEGDEEFYEDEGKRFGIIRKGGEKIIHFLVKGHNEYAASDRKQGEAWACLLIDQVIKNTPKVSEMKELRISYDIKIVRAEKKQGAHYDDALHAAQFVMFFTIQDWNTESKGYGDYFWFGVPVFDSRHDFAPEYRAQDGGKDDCTDGYIYLVAAREFWKTPLTFGKWMRFDHDVLKYIRLGFEDAKARGYLKNSKFEDMTLSTFNTGWEVPGTFDAEAELKNFSVKRR